MSYRVSTQAFTGPFDLLLHLVNRQKVAIGAISISEVADQYLAEVDRMGELDLDVASDFLLVASTLLDMKASSLVPSDYTSRRVEPDEDDEYDRLVTLCTEDNMVIGFNSTGKIRKVPKTNCKHTGRSFGDLLEICKKMDEEDQ